MRGERVATDYAEANPVPACEVPESPFAEVRRFGVDFDSVKPKNTARTLARGLANGVQEVAGSGHRIEHALCVFVDCEVGK